MPCFGVMVESFVRDPRLELFMVGSKLEFVVESKSPIA